MRKRRLLFFTGYFGVGGKERQLTELIKHLPDAYEAYLGVKSADAYYLDELKGKLAGHYSLNKQRFVLSDICWVSKVLKEVQPDVVLCWSDVLAHFCYVLNKLSSTNYQLINCTVRDAPVFPTLGHRLEALLLNLYPVVVGNSVAGLHAYGQWGKPGRYVIYNGFDAKRIPEATKLDARLQCGFAKEPFSICMVSAMREAKDHLTLLLAANECMHKDPSIKFYITGDGPTKEYVQAKVLQLKLPNVQLLGNRKDVEYIMRACDISVLCSARWHGEGISNAILESLACGTPVIATDNGGTKEIVLHGENGYIIKNGDFIDLAEKILYLKNNPSILDALAQSAPNVLTKFTMKTMVAGFLNLINEQVA